MAIGMPLGNILITIAEHFAKLLPFRIIHDYEQALRYTFGHAGQTMRGPEKGYCFFIPLIQRVDIVDATWGQVRLDTLSVQAKNKTKLSISGAVIYRVKDARDYLLRVSDGDSAATLRAVAKGCVASVVMGNGYTSIHKDKEHIETSVARIIQEEVDEWGMEIRDVYLHDVVESRNIHLHGMHPFVREQIEE